jgi:hypothetical protein
MYIYALNRSRGSSVSVVSDYGLDDRAIGVRSPAGAKDFASNLCVQTGSQAHPHSCTMGTGSPCPGEKGGRGVKLTTHSHLVTRSSMSRSYTSSPPSATMACNGSTFCMYLILSIFRFFGCTNLTATRQSHSHFSLCG